eukprot:7442588-Pyramimonas_sp.AAC.1
MAPEATDDALQDGQDCPKRSPDGPKWHPKARRKPQTASKRPRPPLLIISCASSLSSPSSPSILLLPHLPHPSVFPK